MDREADHVDRAIDAATAVYRWLLHLYPREFACAFGDELESDFREMSFDARTAGGRGALIRAWLSAARDLAISVPREWLRTPWLPILAVAAAVAALVFYGSMGRFYRAVPPGTTRPESPALFLLMALMVLIPLAGTILIGCATRWFVRRAPRPRRRV